MPKIIDDKFRDGQAEYARGISAREIINGMIAASDGDDATMDAAMSRLIGYLDGLVQSIRRTESLIANLRIPAGPKA